MNSNSQKKPGIFKTLWNKITGKSNTETSSNIPLQTTYANDYSLTSEKAVYRGPGNNRNDAAHAAAAAHGNAYRQMVFGPGKPRLLDAKGGKKAKKPTKKQTKPKKKTTQKTKK